MSCIVNWLIFYNQSTILAISSKLVQYIIQINYFIKFDNICIISTGVNIIGSVTLFSIHYDLGFNGKFKLVPDKNLFTYLLLVQMLVQGTVR